MRGGVLEGLLHVGTSRGSRVEAKPESCLCTWGTTLQLPQGIWVIGHEYRYVLGRLHLPLGVHDAEGDIVVAMVAFESFRDGGLTALRTN